MIGPLELEAGVKKEGASREPDSQGGRAAMPCQLSTHPESVPPVATRGHFTNSPSLLS